MRYLKSYESTTKPPEVGDYVHTPYGTGKIKRIYDTKEYIITFEKGKNVVVGIDKIIWYVKTEKEYQKKIREMKFGL